MARRRRTSRLYWRERGGQRRAYADLRAFRDVGGGQEALVAPGESSATTDQDIAERLLTDRVAELEQRRRNRTLLGIEREATLQDFASYHLVEKAKSGRVTAAWLEQTERQLRVAVAFFGAGRDVASIAAQDVQQYVGHLRASKGRQGRPLLDSSIRHYLNSLSNMYRRAVQDGLITVNPVSALMEKPSGKPREARWLDVPTCTLVLEAARRYRPQANAPPFLHELLATLALTGGRWAEVKGLTRQDVSFRRELVTFRPNRWRGLKTESSHRSVPLWPQLASVLRPYVLESGLAPDSLLFPSNRGTEMRMLDKINKSLDGVGKLADMAPGELRTRIFRHTYCAARLQTVERVQLQDGSVELVPMDPFAVGRELGHGGGALVDRIYGHTGRARHRSLVVEYRLEQHREELAGRLAAIEGAA